MESIRSIEFDPSKVRLLRANPHSVVIDINGEEVYCFWRLWNRIANAPYIEAFIEETDRGNWLAMLNRF